MASRFIVGQIDLSLTENCSVTKAIPAVRNYTTCKFSEDGVTISIHADALQ